MANGEGNARGGGLDYSEQSMDYFLREDSLAFRNVRRLSGSGIAKPGYRIRGERGAVDTMEGVAPVQVVKVVSPLTGQGPASPLDTGRYANMNLETVEVSRYRVQKRVAPTIGSKVVRPKRTAIRRMNTRGQGTVDYY